MKLLFVAVPLTGENLFDNRSGFIWNVLSLHFEADLLLVKTPEFLTRKVPDVSGYQQYYSIVSTPGSPLKTKAVHQFSRDNLEKFSRILLNNSYQIVFFQNESLAELAKTTCETLPCCHILFDINKPLSIKELQLWTGSPSKQNFARHLEYISLQMMEKHLFRQPFHFFLSSVSAIGSAQKISDITETDSRFYLLPAPMDFEAFDNFKFYPSDKEKALLRERFILFYGDLGSENNLDAFQFLTKELYSHISKILQEKDIKIYVVGKNAKTIHEQLCGGRIRLFGEVDDVRIYLKAALLIILPLRRSASTKRIAEAAGMGKAVLTTLCGISEYPGLKNVVAVENDAKSIAERLTLMVKDQLYTLELGQNLHDRMVEQFDAIKVEQQFLKTIKDITAVSAAHNRDNLKVAVITNFFGTKAGRTGTHVYNLSQKLAETCKVTIICPCSDSNDERDINPNFEIVRFKCIKIPGRLFRHKPRTFCPGIFPYLLKNGFDIIHCYSGLSLNGVLAYIASKIKEIPFIMNRFDLPDPEEEDKYSLRKQTLNLCKNILIRNADFIFTVTEQSSLSLRKLNQRVEQIPIPNDTAISLTGLPDVKARYYLTEPDFVFLCLGNVARNRGQDLLIKAYAASLPFLPNSKLVIVGDTDFEPDFYEELELLVSREGLQGEVIFTDKVPREEAIAWLRAADILVIPARRLQSINVILDSWECGTPVLQSDAVDPNLVTEGYNSFLFRSEDLEDLSQQLQKAYRQRAYLPEMAKRGQALINSRYNYDFLVNRYLETYKQLTLS